MSGIYTIDTQTEKLLKRGNKMLNKLKKIFSFDDIDLSRRKFIKDAGSLAALTVVGLTAPSLLKVNELQAQINSGRISGQTFYLTEPIIIDLPNVIIDNCTFIEVKPIPYMLELTDNANNCVIQYCTFERYRPAYTAADAGSEKYIIIREW